MPARFTVRKVRPADLNRILEIERASFGADAYDRNLFAEYLGKCGDLFLAVERRGIVRGYLIAGARGRRAELISVAVSPADRGAGAASAMMESVLRRLRARGVERLFLTVKTSNLGAQAFYAKYAFEFVRRVPRYYEDGSDGSLMARQV
jgi:ribosomal protein S18 acetylase RimI-like enzyme